MAALRRVLIVAGAVAAFVGLFWIGQGLGYIRWPASSFMIARTEWADRGAAVAVVGLILILVARRLPRRGR